MLKHFEGSSWSGVPAVGCLSLGRTLCAVSPALLYAVSLIGRETSRVEEECEHWPLWTSAQRKAFGGIAVRFHGSDLTRPPAQFPIVNTPTTHCQVTLQECNAEIGAPLGLRC